MGACIGAEVFENEFEELHCRCRCCWLVGGAVSNGFGSGFNGWVVGGGRLAANLTDGWLVGWRLATDLTDGWLVGGD